jgi:ubiquinone/menaquinone biosynthesis C-methylase UbiE
LPDGVRPHEFAVWGQASGIHFRVENARRIPDRTSESEFVRPDPALPRLYTDLASLWPLVSDPADYAEEARHWREALRAKLGPGRHAILELGVGGGNNLSHLRDEFDATAVDLSDAMLEHSRRLNPGVTHVVGDMRTVRLGRRFRAVLIHDAIDYLVSEDDIRATFATAFEHLEPGGLFVCAPDWFRETLRTPSVTLHGPRGTDPQVTFLEYVHDPDPRDTTIETVFVFVVRRGGKVEVIEDRHTQGLFPMETWMRLLGEAGFRPDRWPYPVHEDGHPGWLLLGRR